MKIRKSILTVFIAALAVSVCAVGVMASDTGNFNEVKSAKEYLSAEGRTDVIEKIELGEMTDEERLVAEGYSEEAEKLREAKEKHQQRYETDEKYRKECDDLKAWLNQLDEKAADVDEACERLLKLSGLYSDGVNSVLLKYDKEYLSDYRLNLCFAYSEHKQEISDNDRLLVENCLDNIYNIIVSQNELTKKDAETYKLIEKTINVKLPANPDRMKSIPVTD